MSSMFIAVRDGKLLTGALDQAAFTNASTLRRSIGQKQIVIRDENGRALRWARVKKDEYQVVELDLSQILTDLKEKGFIDYQ